MSRPPGARRGVEESTVSRPNEPEIEGNNDEDLEEYPTGLEVQPRIPLIFVMGVSGAGKSSFIKTLGGKDSKKQPPVTSAIESVTREVGVYKTILHGQEVLLVDTPGFEDNETSNLETLQKICEYILQVANNPVLIVRGAVYLHNIATSRWVAGDERTWSILKALCGDAAMGNVVVATTRWPADHEDEDYEELEKRNLENYWEGILGTVRLAKNDVQNSRIVIQRLFGVPPKTFQVQRELSSGNTPSDTSAGRISTTEGEEALRKAEKEREAALAELGRITLRVEPVRSQNAPRLTQPSPLEMDGPSTADFKKEMDTLLQCLESAVLADRSQLGEAVSSEKTLQEEIQHVQASLKEKEDLLKEYHQLLRKIESADKLKEGLNTARKPVNAFKTSMADLLSMLVAGGTIVMRFGAMSFPFYGFAALSGVALYQGVKEMFSEDAEDDPDMEYQIPTMDVEEGVE